MASSERRNILIAGLGAKVSATAVEELKFDPSETHTLVNAEVEKARAGGFDCTVVIAEPEDFEGTMKKWRAELGKQQWDGVSIGYAVRALKENTVLFEALVNAAVEGAPGAKFVFPEGRTDIWESVQRVFLKGKGT